MYEASPMERGVILNLISSFLVHLFENHTYLTLQLVDALHYESISKLSMGRRKGKQQQPSRQARQPRGGSNQQPPRRAPRRAREYIDEPITFRGAGAKVGEFLGAGAGSLLGKIFGMGAYTVEQNVLLSPSGTIGPPPIFQTRPDGSVIVCHREFVSTIAGSTAYAMQLQQPINPSNSFLFPRLSQLATTFEEHRPLGIVFEFLTTSGTAVGSTNTALGTVMMATNYDVLDPPFQNKQDLESYKFSTATVPCSSVYHPVECKPSQSVNANRFISDPLAYSASGALTVQTNQDRRLYDVGLFQVATQGQQATNIVGEVWVSYCWELLVPRKNPYASMAHLGSTLATNTAAAPLASALLSSGSDMAVAITNTSFTIPVSGSYVVTMCWSGATIGAAVGLSVGSNIIAQTVLNNYTGTACNAFTATTAVAVVTLSVFTSGTGAANAITLTGLTGMTAAQCDIMILRRPQSGGSLITGF